MDRRTRNTRRLLADALIKLAPEKGFNAVRVEDMTRTAGLGRSTFYDHFAGKADYLDRSLGDMLRAMSASEVNDGAGLLPMRRFLGHLRATPAFVNELAASGALEGLLGRSERVLRQLAEANIAQRFPAITGPLRRHSAVMLAGAFTGLVRWWINAGMTPEPETVQVWLDRFAEAALSGSAQPNA